MRAMRTGPKKFGTLLVSILVLFLDVPIGSAMVIEDVSYSNSAIEETPYGHISPLFCDGEGCQVTNREPEYSPLDSSPPVMEFGWWFDFWSDLDENGMDDRLQMIIAGERESVSKTSIIGQDNKSTVAIIVHYAWHPGPSDIESIRLLIESHGWEREGSWFMVMDHLDAIVLDHVPISSLLEIWRLDGVVLIEEQNVIVPYLNLAAKGSKVRPSDVYDETIRGLGFHGSGKVIAILDTGVDNEHFSLDDFSDDNNDNTNDPDDLTDPKYLGGCDSTGLGSSGCNDEDPDDGDGHGTHVAGIALGTGDSSKENQGYAPGSYLVDVKVMEDYGGGNSQSILAGLQWVINNRDTDWGNNASSRGIQVASMSFGNANFGGGDGGDNGTSAEASLVNQASENGIVCIAAIGNDGANNVNSVGAADTSITVGWGDDKNTIDREDDAISSNSNYGPRQNDGDGDSWDEMKPWVVAPGSNINSAQHAESSGIIPGSEVNRASDDYTQKSGSSMSTPAVAGLVAIMLEIGEDRNMEFMDEDEPGIERYEAIRSFLASGSEFREGWSIDDTFEGNNWNSKYGFGIMDGGNVAREMFGTGGGDGSGGNQTTGPGGTQEGHWVEIESPEKWSWLVEGETYSLRGSIDEDGRENGTIEEVVAYVEIEYREPGMPKSKEVLVNWTNPIGVLNWTIPFVVPEFPEDYTEISVCALASARNEIGRWSNNTELCYHVGRVNITLESPSGTGELEGLVQVSGLFQSIYNATIEWRLDNEEWEFGAFYDDGWDEEVHVDGREDHDACVHMFRGDSSGNCPLDDYGWTEWGFNWDTTRLKDDEYRLSVRIVSAVGVVSEEIRRQVRVDNVDPMPDLLFVSRSISVQEFGIPIKESYVNTFLEVRATIRNTGDKAATDVGIVLEEWGERRDEYIIANIDSGEFVEVVLYWNPMEAGSALISISLDPVNIIEELDDANNELSGTFEVLPRPPGVDLAIREGAIYASTVSSPIPRPNEPAVVQSRVDNLGSEDATGVEGTLEMNTDRGWEQVESATLPLILGGSHSTISFPFTPNQTGPIELRISVLMENGSDNNMENNVRTKTVLVDSSTLSGPRDADLRPGESPVQVVSIDEEEGDILITEREGSLLMYKLTPSKSLIECNNIIEDRWSGDLSTVSTDEGFAHIVWTRRYLASNGFLMQTVSYSTIDSSCKMTPIQDLMKGIPLSDGKYWGIDVDVEDTEILVSGYHRDMFGDGSLVDETNIFLIYADSPLSSADWILNPKIVNGIDADPAQTYPLSVELGHEHAHILYQTVRNDSTGKDRLGVWYSHGEVTQETWSYRRAVGDEAGIPKLSVIVEDNEDRLVSLWREGGAQDSELVAYVTDSTFRIEEGMGVRLPARGLSEIELVETDRGIQVMFDMVGPNGPQIEYGLIDLESGWLGLSNSIVSGQLNSIDRSIDTRETMIIISSPGGWQIRTLIDDNSQSRNSGIVDQIRSSLGLDQESFEILVIGVSFAVLALGLVALASLSAQGVRWLGKRRAFDSESSVVMEDDVVDIIGDSDITLRTDEVEIITEDKEESKEFTGQDSRRARRKMRMSNSEDDAYSLELPLDSSDSNDSAIPIAESTGNSTQAECVGCGSRFVVSFDVSTTKCPICGSRVDL